MAEPAGELLVDDVADLGVVVEWPHYREWPAWAVPPHAYSAWEALQEALRGLDEPPLCELDPELWFGLVDVDAARYGCSRCPVREPCAAYAIAADERFGIWGGMTREQRQQGLQAAAG